MGNMLPCLVHSTNSSANMNTSRQNSQYSIELLTRTIHILKRRRRRCNNTETSSVGDRGRKKSTLPTPRALHREGKKQPAAAAGVVRVKVVLTRKEAARLVSLAGEGRRRTAVQLVREVRRMEDAARVDGLPATAWRPVLETISEEEG